MGDGWNNFFEVSISIQLTEENYCDTLALGPSHSQCGRDQARINPFQKPNALAGEINNKMLNCPQFLEIMSAASI